MAKPNPVMKHSKRTALTTEQVAIEDFMNSIPPQVVIEGDSIIDNTIPETIVAETPTLDPIVDSVAVADSLDELAGDVAEVTTATSMESYKRIFGHITELTGHPVASLENFPMTKGGKARFVKAIREHALDIRGCINLAFEEFAGRVDESLGESMNHYKQALGQLNQVREDDFASDEQITINHKQFWKLFHMDGELMNLQDFKKEVENIKDLADMVTKGKDNIVRWSKGEDSPGAALPPNSNKIYLMNNTTVHFKNGRSVFDSVDPPAPKNKEGSWTAGDWFWIFVFSWAGLIYRIVKGGSGKDEAKKEQSLKAIHQVIGELKRLAPIVQGIEKDAKEIISVANSAKEDRRADIKRAASPVLELASKTVHHVTTVTYGAMKMFTQAEQSGN